MCKCTPEIRTPFCACWNCLPPASREPTESLFGANADGDHLAQFKADQLDAWERRLAQFSNRSDSTGYVGRIGVEVLTELRQTREQAEALAAAAEGIVRAIDAHHPKFAQGPFTLTREEIEACRAALRAYREARHDAG